MLNILILQLQRITDSPFELITAQHPSKECAHIKRYLDSNYGENISLDHLSAISHLNKYYLSHEFTKYYGISPMNYLNRKRIEVCKELLENTDYGISDIAHLTGFSSQSYLSQSFRKSCGMTAGTYRKLKKKERILFNIMQYTFPNYYKEFSCIAGACPDTCCADGRS